MDVPEAQSQAPPPRGARRCDLHYVEFLGFLLSSRASSTHNAASDRSFRRMCQMATTAKTAPAAPGRTLRSSTACIDMCDPATRRFGKSKKGKIVATVASADTMRTQDCSERLAASGGTRLPQLGTIPCPFRCQTPSGAGARTPPYQQQNLRGVEEPHALRTYAQAGSALFFQARRTRRKREMQLSPRATKREGARSS